MSTVPILAQNFETKGEFFGGYVFNRLDSAAFLGDLGLSLGKQPGALNVNGFNVSVGKTLGDNTVTDTISLVVDFGGYYSDLEPFESTGLDIYTLTAGPQFTNRKHRYLHPFVRALFGISHVRAEIGDRDAEDTGFAFITGGGVDIRFSKHVAFRLAQLEFMLLRLGSENINSLRVATGIVIPF
jgi:hypothetical protein